VPPRAGAAELIRRLDDPSTRPQVLWHLGQLGVGLGWRPAHARDVIAAVAPLSNDPDPRVRALALEALGKLGGGVPLGRADDPDPGVRAESALAIFRRNYLWKVQQEAPALVRMAADADPEVRWRAAYALQSFPAEREALERLARDEGAWARLFALRGLGKIADPASIPAVAKALSDGGHAVRVEAVRAMAAIESRVRRQTPAAVGASGARGLLPASLAEDPSHHVRAAYARALRSGVGRPEGVLEMLVEDRSILVRAEAVVSLADPIRSRQWLYDANPHLRAAGARVLPLEGSLDGDVHAKQAAAEALGTVNAEAAFRRLCELLQHDIAVRWMAAEALGARGDARAIPELAKLLESDRTLSLEPAIEALERLKAAEPLARHAWLLPEPYGALARRAHFRLTGREAPELSILDRPIILPHPKVAVEYRYPHAPREGKVRLELRHRKGRLVMELDRSAAPDHVENAVQLARKGYFNGLTWHRVESNFVLQGGCPRGDGFGDPGWRILDEINPLKHTRGAVGMSKMIKDTGDSQFYITLVPAPHLDGRYTVFGYVVEGMDVVDRIDLGDSMEARVLDR
jgi:peptidyl-prolyl cis-trans isomerase B (cyclophilin B)